MRGLQKKEFNFERRGSDTLPHYKLRWWQCSGTSQNTSLRKKNTNGLAESSLMSQQDQTQGTS